MKVQLTTSLGHRDARRLDIAEARESDVIEVDGPALAELIERKWAVPYEPREHAIRAGAPPADRPRGAVNGARNGGGNGNASA